MHAFRHEWPQWAPQDLTKIFPMLDAKGLDLMKKMFEYDPAHRISVSKQACVVACGTQGSCA